MAGYRFSRFISRTDVDDGVTVLIGGTAGAMLGVDGRYRSRLESAMAVDDPAALPIWIGEQLRQAQMIIPRTVDELAVLSLRRQLARADRRALTLTIAPTLHCNLACPYCYERGVIPRGPMSPAVQDRVLDMVSKELSPGGLLTVTWYGGEPLLAVDVIDRLGGQLALVCASKGARLVSDVVTNATLMDENAVRWMLGAGIERAQITVDGPKEVHDRRRVHRDGAGTYETIMANVERASSLGLKVLIRINVDTANSDRAGDLIDLLGQSGLLKHVRVSVGQVTDEGCSSCFNNEEFADVRGRLMTRVLDWHPAAIRPPRARPLACAAEAVNSFVIDPDGRLYKCWLDVMRPERAFGLAGIGWNLVEPNLLRWLARPDPVSDPRCSRCNLLPLCMGGCPARAKDCDSIRYDWPTLVANYFQAVLRGGGGRE